MSDFPIKHVHNDDDIERLAAFNGHIHGESVISMTRELIKHHPYTRPEHWLFIEDNKQIISTLCLIPWTWKYEDVELKAGELGIVGTLEAYRGRGLIRQLVKHHHQLLADGDYDLSHIQGIPYFYRQFGYEYALPLEGGYQLELHAIPDSAELPTESPLDFRLATPDDIPVLMRLYEEMCKQLNLSIYTQRTPAIWQYQLGPGLKSEPAADTFLILDSEQQPIGYFRVEHYGFGNRLNINECTVLPPDAIAPTLRKFKALAIERNKPNIRLNIPDHHPLIACTPTHSRYRYAWQIHLPNPARLLHKLAPVFERRIAKSIFAGLSRSYIVNTYRRAYELKFESGKLIAVNDLGFHDGDSSLSLPPQLLAPLVLGYRTFDELRFMYPDVSTWGNDINQHLTDILFPRVHAFIQMAY